mmetsp:Transcript_8363/g.9711  ORF Transcript_8363/g.9711 Transcript_8363/m.9711 type:complete len:84 (-) Transcript_8363:197-448(-)
MGDAFSKDGCITQAFEHIPIANLGVALAHAANGNTKEAARSSVKGFSTGLGLAVGGIGGPAAGLATGAALHGAASQLPKAFEE